MAILIANIGTSDLAIQVIVDGTKYYLPIDPLPEINQDREGLTLQEIDMWKEPRKYFRDSGLYTELGFPENVEPTSRKLTERLLEHYKNNFEYWHSRIHAPRIWGVVKKAVSMGINQGYIFVTNQQSDKFPEGHDKDTKFLYEILALWFKDKYPNFIFTPEVIPQNVRVYIPDDLFQYYYDFFNRLSLTDSGLKRQKKYPQVGEILSGQVVGFDGQNQGVFIEVNGGLKGFLNLANISQDAITTQSIRKIFQVDDLVWVKVIESEEPKLRFSTKELEQTPGEIIHNSQAVFDRIKREISINSQSDTQAPPEEELMLISVKGGTPQMKTALQLQGVSVSTVKRLLFVNPLLSIRDVFTGLPSSCDLEAYWRYMRTQKYQTIKLLLERWDFDGAIQILQNWQEYLKYLIAQGILGKDEVEKSSNVSKLVLTALDFARACFNLDFQTAKTLAQTQIESYPELNVEFFQELYESAKKYGVYQHRLLSLYTQNRIYWKLDQIASFLSHLSSFGEEVLHGLILKWESKANYWIAQTESDIKAEFKFDIYRLQTNRRGTWEKFVDLQRNYNPDFGTRPRTSYSLKNRYEKRNFVAALVQFRNRPDEVEAWNRLCKNLEQLDFWIELRNKLIHTATGVSKQLMQDLYDAYTPEAGKTAPCPPLEILATMAAITKNKLVDLKTIYHNDFVGEAADYYIYTSVIDWVVNILVNDGLQ
ncbi:S1 RNA-binding domain-containing protein [Nostoc sp.]|uniref:S1 RNA-binding domain-containing protein n=1 Tax=Nostoc sp. TaxID=1180 RepID=UPI002FF33039